MTARERVWATVNCTTPDRTPYLRWDNFAATDIVAPWARKQENLAPLRKDRVDEWGCRWETLHTTVGQISHHPIESCDGYASFTIPSVNIDLAGIQANRREYPDKISSGGVGFFFMEILEKLRGFNGAMMDMAADRDVLEPFLDRLQAYYISVVDAYAASGCVDCICMNEDLGLQDRLTISPDMWREIFKPRYKAVYDRIHKHGMLVFQHSCGYVQDIIADCAEIGVDIIELQQMECMDMEAVAAARGKMCISAPVDIQTVLQTNDWPRIAAFQRRLFRTFDRIDGGYMPQMYCDLASIGVKPQLGKHLEELILQLCDWRKNPAILTIN